MKAKGFTKQQIMVGTVAGLVILVLGGRLLAQAVNVIAPDTVPGYYALAVNPAPNATPDQQSADMAFGLVRLSLGTDHTFSFGALRGTWSRFGSKVTLSPNSTEAPFSTTTMADTLSVMTKSIDLDISQDGKKLTAEKAGKGPISFTKTSDAIR